MVTLTIDRQIVRVQDETPIIEAARQLEINIPTLCHHEALKPYGACRLCVVEIVNHKRSGLVTSCNYPAREGLAWDGSCWLYRISIGTNNLILW